VQQLAALELQDKIPAKVHTVFVGINPAIRSAQVGHYYAHPTNKFWTLIRESGLAPEALDATYDDQLVKQGFGFTDVAKRPTIAASHVTPAEFSSANDRITRLVQDAKPRTLVFVSKKAARAFLNVPDNHPIRYGKQRRSIGTTAVWFLPSTSGQSYADGDYPSKLQHFRRLAKHVKTYLPKT
jgi:double-stranded uracil-DNA glycosylase